METDREITVVIACWVAVCAVLQFGTPFVATVVVIGWNRWRDRRRRRRAWRRWCSAYRHLAGLPPLTPRRDESRTVRYMDRKDGAK